MEKNNFNTVEFNDMDLIKIIYNEIKEIKDLVNNNINKSANNINEIESNAEFMDILKMDFKETKKCITEIKTLVKKNANKLDDYDNKFDRLEKKIDSNFKTLYEKIYNEKNKLISEASEIFEDFSITTYKSIKNIENKINNEKNERIIEIENIKDINDYNKIILKNLESRISILEEETEKYALI